MDDAKAFGRRLREVRIWRRLSIREAAGLAGRPLSFWGQVERGERAVNSRNTLEAMAGALRVHPSELTGQPWTQQDTHHADAQAGLEGIEIALERYALGVDPEVAVRAWPQLTEDLERLVTTMRWTADYAAQSELAPVLIGELHSAYVRLPHQRLDVSDESPLQCHVGAHVVADDQVAGIDPEDLGVHGGLRGDRIRRQVGLVIVAGGYLGGGHYRFSLFVAVPVSWPTPVRETDPPVDAGGVGRVLSACGTHSPKRRRPTTGRGCRARPAGVDQPGYSPAGRVIRGLVHPRWAGRRGHRPGGRTALECAIPQPASKRTSTRLSCGRGRESAAAAGGKISTAPPATPLAVTLG